MVNLTDEQKSLFYTGGNFKDYVFYFPDLDLKITNDTIHEEAVTIKEAICEENELKLGGCIASSIEFEVSEVIQHDLTGLEFSTTLYVNLKDDGTYDLKLPMGVYRVESAKMVDDRDYKKVIAYDTLYDASINVLDWYDSVLPKENKDASITIKNMRESLLEHLGISYIKQNLINDDYVIKRTIDTNEIKGTDVLKNICEINGGFGRINREGFFEVVVPHGLGLFPEDSEGKPGNKYPNVYPEETLYPEDYFQYIGATEEDGDPHPEYRETKFEEFMCPKITCTTVKQSQDDFGTTVGDNTDNPYVISGNWILFTSDKQKLETVSENILDILKDIEYRPNTTKLDGLPYMEVGDVFSLKKKTKDVESYVFSRTLTGVQGLVDTYEAKGNDVRANEVSKSDEIIQLRGKTLVLRKSIDEVSSELTDFEKGTNSKFEQTDEWIELKVGKIGENKGTVFSAIKVEADRITTEVEKREEQGRELSSKIEQTAESITSEVTARENQGRELSSKIEQTADRITSEVSSATSKYDTSKYKNEITLFGYEDGNKILYDPNKNNGRSYLNQKNGYVYLSASGSWVHVATLPLITETLSSEIEQTDNQIVLKVNSDGDMAEVSLGVDPDDESATRFTVKAQNIEMDADEAIRLMAGGTIDLSSEEISIDSKNFTVDSEGTVTARSLDISGGSVNIETCNTGSGAIDFKNASFSGAYEGIADFYAETKTEMNSIPKKYIKNRDVCYVYNIGDGQTNGGSSGFHGFTYYDGNWYTIGAASGIEPPKNNMILKLYGGGSPKETPEELDARYGAYYADLDSGVLYKAIPKVSGSNKLKWGKTSNTIPLNSIEAEELKIGTDGMMSIEKYTYDDRYGYDFKVTDGMIIDYEGIQFSKSGFTEYGSPYSGGGNLFIERTGLPDSSGNAQMKIVSSVPIDAPNIKSSMHNYNGSAFIYRDTNKSHTAWNGTNIATDSIFGGAGTYIIFASANFQGVDTLPNGSKGVRIKDDQGNEIGGVIMWQEISNCTIQCYGVAQGPSNGYVYLEAYTESGSTGQDVQLSLTVVYLGI